MRPERFWKAPETLQKSAEGFWKCPERFETLLQGFEKRLERFGATFETFWSFAETFPGPMSARRHPLKQLLRVDVDRQVPPLPAGEGEGARGKVKVSSWRGAREPWEHW